MDKLLVLTEICFKDIIFALFQQIKGYEKRALQTKPVIAPFVE